MLKPLEPGMPAPDFTLPADDGAAFTLSAHRGRPVVLYFYAQDDTETCTRQACEFRDAMPRFDAADALVVGVSPDSVRSHAKFKARYELPFTLLADTDRVVCAAYDVWQEKQLYGRTYMGVERTTFVIDAEGRIARRFSKVRGAGHASRVMEAVTAL